ncbi:hypothetical protein AMELA_G00237170 [Ameiurus melas]|uniref:Uncharacterized protein n=1 Tax=Ameiurus melas TaxID=219545 RepID=A0A7J5ZX00_AMEME|nr:hypothetical protein AMELA_G00237170 [Ameiurus melas]
MSSSTSPVTWIAAQIMCTPQNQTSPLLSALLLLFAAHTVSSSSPILRRRSARHRVEHARAHRVSPDKRAAEVISTHIRRHILPLQLHHKYHQHHHHHHHRYL